MKELILIVPALTKSFDQKKAKQKMIGYLGTRLIEECRDEMPGLIINQVLSDEDREELNKLIFNDSADGCLLFLTLSEESNTNLDYIKAEVL